MNIMNEFCDLLAGSTVELTLVPGMEISINNVWNLQPGQHLTFSGTIQYKGHIVKKLLEIANNSQINSAECKVMSNNILVQVNDQCPPGDIEISTQVTGENAFRLSASVNPSDLRLVAIDWDRLDEDLVRQEEAIEAMRHKYAEDKARLGRFKQAFTGDQKKQLIL